MARADYAYSTCLVSDPADIEAILMIVSWCRQLEASSATWTGSGRSERKGIGR